MNLRSKNFSSFLAALLAVACFSTSEPASARKTNQPVYQDPFDLGAGGASLTYASREAALFSNPALLPHGGSFHHWFTSFNVQPAINAEATEFAGNMAKSAQGGSEEEEGGEEGEDDPMADLIDAAMDTPIHVGLTTIPMAWLINHGGFALFTRNEADVVIRKIGDSGIPDVQYELESYSGGVISFAARSPFRWLSFGITGKYFYSAMELYGTYTPSAPSSEDGSSDESSGLPTIDMTTPNTALGYDFGALFFAQGQNVDWRLALKVDDVGGTKFSNDDMNPNEFKQTISAGTSVSFHTGADVIHFALDYRDILGAYKQRNNPEEPEELFKRVYLGTKICLRTYLGLSTGYYNGYPSYGVAFDFIFFRFGAAQYTRELGDHPGVDPRKIYRADLSFGF